jgi:Putative transposase/Transposase zinc-binding domain
VQVRPAFELADVFRRHGESYERANAGHLGRVERRVIGAITACRTAALGGHVEQCNDCGLTRIAYNSCRNRHCGKCQGTVRAEWLAARQAELLPVPYFHVVFTLPPAAAEIAFQNKQTVYGLLMRAAAEALMTLAAARLAARIGLIAVLHTWGQTLTHHPHVHCLVPGGGVALDGQRWVGCKPNFLLSVRALSKTFRRLFLDGLAAVFRRGELGFFGELAPLADPGAFVERVRALRQSAFVVYAKPPFGGPERVLAYLARYTHRTAIANSRIVAVDEDELAFSYKDYRRGGRGGVMRLAPHEFIRRFLLHVLPDGFHRIRHYGFLAKGDRGESLARIRALLKVQRTLEPANQPQPSTTSEPKANTDAGKAFDVCPVCGGLMRRIGLVARHNSSAFRCDTS